MTIYLSPFHMSSRLESQMTTDIQTILQLLQKQSTVVPPAYSMVTAGAEYQRPVLRLLRTSQTRASIKTDRSFSPSSQVSVDTVKPRVSLWVYLPGHLSKNQEPHWKIWISIFICFCLEFLETGPVFLHYVSLKVANNGFKEKFKQYQLHVHVCLSFVCVRVLLGVGGKCQKISIRFPSR